jgi:ABC-type branched-subunit amino acid transport system substrate-binding protein
MSAGQPWVFAPPAVTRKCLPNRQRGSIDFGVPRLAGTATTKQTISGEKIVQRPFLVPNLVRSQSRLIPLAATFALSLAGPAQAQSGDPIKIGVIAEVQSIAGAATPGGAQIAASEINAKGGILGRQIEIVTYDNKSSSADSVRAFQRAAS